MRPSVRGRGPIIKSLKVPRADWLHGLAVCPGCGIDVDDRDTVEQLFADRSPTPAGVLAEHRRCGAVSRVLFVASASPR